MRIMYIKDFTEFPGPRYCSLGQNSGEEFRDKCLIPALHKNEPLSINFDGVYGYGSSFLEEAFGGLVRAGIEQQKLLTLMDNLVSNDDPTLLTEVNEYITDALKAREDS